MSTAVSHISSGELTPTTGSLSPAREKVRRLEAEVAKRNSEEAAELREKCRTLDGEVAALRMDAAGNVRLLRKAQRDLDERAKRLEAMQRALEAKDAQMMDQRLLKTEVQRLQRLVARATADRERRRVASEAADETEAPPEGTDEAATAAAAAERRATAAEADAGAARKDLGNCLEELARFKAEAVAFGEERKELLERASAAEEAADAAAATAAVPAAAPGLADDPAFELAAAQSRELDRLKTEVTQFRRLVELSASSDASVQAALDAERREAAALRETNVAMHTGMLAETGRLRGIAEAALAECAEQGDELTRLRSTAEVQGGRPQMQDSGHVVPGELIEAMQELERLEVTIVEERHKSADLLTRTLASEDAHARDVGALEQMLQELMGENERLANQVSAWEHTKLDCGKDPYSSACAGPPSLPDLSPGGRHGCDSPMMDEPETEALPMYSSPVPSIRRPPSCPNLGSPMLQQPLQHSLPPFPAVSGSQICAPQLQYPYPRLIGGRSYG